MWVVGKPIKESCWNANQMSPCAWASPNLKAKATINSTDATRIRMQETLVFKFSSFHYFWFLHSYSSTGSNLSKLNALTCLLLTRLSGLNSFFSHSNKTFRLQKFLTVPWRPKQTPQQTANRQRNKQDANATSHWNSSHKEASNQNPQYRQQQQTFSPQVNWNHKQHNNHCYSSFKT